jgi:hypothetical protein
MFVNSAIFANIVIIAQITILDTLRLRSGHWILLSNQRFVQNSCSILDS